MNGVDRGALMSLALDAVDPRLGGDQRAAAAAATMGLDEWAAGAVWSAMLFCVLESVRDIQGEAAAADLMGALAEITLRMLDAEPERG